MATPNSNYSGAEKFADSSAHLKAALSRYWALNLSCPVLDGILPEDHWLHWSVLICCIRYLSGNSIRRFISNKDPNMWLGRCADFLTRWLKDVPRLYGNWALTLSVHLTSHVCRNVRLFGPLWAVNCFAFETYNSVIKRNIHSCKGGQHNEFASTYVTMLTLREVIDRYVRAESIAARLLVRLGYPPLSMDNAAEKSTWKATADVDTYLVDVQDDIVIDGEDGPIALATSGMLYRCGMFLYSRAHKSFGVVQRFSSCVMVQRPDPANPASTVEYPAFIDLFIMNKESKDAFAQITPLADRYTSLPLSRFPLARLAPVDHARHGQPILVPLSDILRNLFFLHVPNRKFQDGHEYGYVQEYVHAKTIDPSLPLYRYYGKYSQVVLFEVV